MRNISFTPQAYADYLNWLATDKKIFLKITNLIKETARNPESGTGKPERLKHELAGLWSRRIDMEHRLVYRIKDKAIEIISCRYHYHR
jgi:toxin YoeB